MLVLLVAHGVYPPFEELATFGREELAQACSVLESYRVPAHGCEHVPHPVGDNARHDPVEGLPVQVNDPKDFTEVWHPGVHQRFPNRSLIELSIADQCNVATSWGATEMGRYVAVRNRAPY